MEIKDLIKSLVQQCNIESISTKDMAKELGQLYTQVENLDAQKKRLEETNTSKCNELIKAQQELADFKRTFVDPVTTLQAKRVTFEQEKFKFDVEKEYMKREVDTFKEIVKSLTCSHSVAESYYGGNNGSNWNKNQVTDKPNLPGQPNLKMDSEPK